MPTRDNTWARTLTAICAVFCLLQYVAWEPALLAPALLLLLALACLVAVTWSRTSAHALPLGTWLATVASVAGVVVLAIKSEFLAVWSPAVVLVPVLMIGCALYAILGRGRRALVAFGVLIGAWVVVALGDLAMIEVVIDVQPLLEDGIDAALAGDSPYGINVENMYGPRDTERFYGPGVVQDGRVIFGYPYLPAPLLLDIPAHLLGDVRWMHMVAIVGAAVVAWRLATDALGRACAVLLLLNPLAITVLVAYWIEPVMVLLLALSVLALIRRSRLAGPLIGLLFASKQFAVSFVPALWSVGRSVGWRVVWIAAAVGGVVVGAFFLWDPSAFVGSAIEFHLRQPFREESISLLPALDQLLGGVPDWISVVAPVLGLLVSVLVALRTRPGPTAFALGVGLSLLFTVLISKQAHMNYYFLLGSALTFAVITWPTDDPIPPQRQPEETASDA